MKKISRGSVYLNAHERSSKGKRKSALLAAISSGLSLLVLSTVALTSVAGISPTVSAATAEEQAIQDVFNDYGIERDDEGFERAIDLAEEQPGTPFSEVINRLFTIDYMNDVESAVVAGELQSTLRDKSPNLASPASTKLACSPDATGAGTVVYHNCDIPNILTEFFQDTISLVDSSGLIAAETEQATALLGLGVPKYLPGDGTVPVDPNARSDKYTGLELFGYNLRFSSYGGEWDHVKTMTQARTLSNFGFFDSIKLSAQSVVNGITSGLQTQVNNLADSLGSGDIFGAIGGGFSGFVSGAAGGGVKTILDTSDLNVIASNSWYRVGFGATTYGARELTDAELAAQARATFLQLLNDGRPIDASVDAELSAIQGGPVEPLEAIASCEFVNSEGASQAFGNVSTDPGPSEDACEQQAQRAFEDRKDAYDDATATNSTEEAKYRDSLRERNQYLADNPGDVAGAPALYVRDTVDVPYADSQSPDFTWDEEGTQELETIVEWRSNNAGMFDTAFNYGMSCEINNVTESARASTVAAVKNCWGSEWPAAAERNIVSNQTGINTDWLSGVIDPVSVAQWVAGDQSKNNFNAPWNRFVCTDANGDDIKTATGQNIRVYDQYGNLNEACGGAIRSPIQGGLFGDGYERGQVAGAAGDTRHISNFGGVFDNVILPSAAISGTISNGLLTISQFMTQVSNEIIALTFSPLLQAINFDEIVVDLIEGFRDSIFFPLSVLMVIFGALYSLWKAVTTKQYREQFLSLLFIALTFIGGVVLMARPAETVKAVDQIPAYIETAVVGSIYEFGRSQGDEVCTYTGAASGDGAAFQGFDPRGSTRTLMCENWRVFVLTPWIYGQWGADMDQLYSAESEMPGRLSNSNGELVGDASVAMGGGVTMNNWAIYQLDQMSAGTATTTEPHASGTVDKDMYKIVDVQAGPNGGAGTDGTYLEAWTGSDLITRPTIALFSTIAAGFGAVAIAIFAFTKIILSLTSLIMLIFLPFVFLIGLFPGKRSIVRNYLMTLLGIMVQRVALMVVLAIFLKLLLAFTTSVSGNYALVAISAIILSIALLSFRKRIMSMVLSSSGGGSFGGQMVSDPDGWAKRYTPNSALQAVRTVGTMGRSVVAGTVSGVASGRGLKGVRSNVKNSWDAEGQKLRNSIRRKGFGTVYGMRNTAKTIKNEVAKDIKNDSDTAYVRQQALAGSKGMKTYDAGMKDYSKLASDKSKRFVELTEPKLDERGKEIYLNGGEVLQQMYLIDTHDNNKRIMDKPIKPKLDESPAAYRNIRKLKELHQLMEELESSRDSIYEKQASKIIAAATGSTKDHRFGEDAKLDEQRLDALRESIRLNEDSTDKAMVRQQKKVLRIEERKLKLQAEIDKYEDLLVTRSNYAKKASKETADIQASIDGIQEYLKELDARKNTDKKSSDSKPDPTSGGEPDAS